MLGKSFLGRMLWNHSIHVNKPHPCFVNMPNELICFLGGLSAVKPWFFTGTLEARGGRCCVVNSRVYTHCYKIVMRRKCCPTKHTPCVLTCRTAWYARVIYASQACGRKSVRCHSDGWTWTCGKDGQKHVRLYRIQNEMSTPVLLSFV